MELFENEGVWPYYSWHGHTYDQVNLYTGSGHGTRARRYGATLGSIEIRSAEAGRSLGRRQGTGGRERRSSSTGSVAKVLEPDVSQSTDVGPQRQERAPGIVVTTKFGATMIHLDTSFLIRALVRNSAEDFKLRTWLRARTRVGMSLIAWAQFLCGPVETNDVDLAARIIQDRVPFVDEDAG